MKSENMNSKYDNWVVGYEKKGVDMICKGKSM